MNLDLFLNHLEKDTPQDSTITAELPVEMFTIRLESYPLHCLSALGGYGFIRDVSYAYEKDGFCFDVLLILATDGLTVERLV